MIERALQDELNRVVAEPILLVACDFDGTLAAIAPSPIEARADEGSMAALHRLTQLESTHVAIVTGRSRNDVALKVGNPRDLVLIGGHGAEADGMPSVDPGQIELLRAAMQVIAARYEGALVEGKSTGVAVHYRHVAQPLHAEFRSAVRAAAEQLHCPLIRDGLLVVETGLVKADKGESIRQLAHHFNAQSIIFIGDDLTDEDAFAALRPGDIGIKVGSAETAAGFSVKDHLAVRALLEELVHARTNALQARRITPIDDLALLSDQRTCALIDAAGRIVWMCSPRFDSTPVFADLLGGANAGFFEVTPLDDRTVISRRYEPDTFLLRTEYSGLTVTDYLDCSAGRAFQRAGRTDLIRLIEGHGKVRIRFAPRIDFGRMPTRLRVSDLGIIVEGSSDPITLHAPGVRWSLEEFGPHQTAVATAELAKGPLTLELRLGSYGLKEAPIPEPTRRNSTRTFWTAWANTLRLPPRHPDLVRRSALVIKALCYGPTGAICAAATTSLPEQLGGVRNWDYRFCWVRDSAMSAAALVRLGSPGHAMKLLDWLNGIMEDVGNPERLRPIYTVRGSELGPEGEISEMSGYGNSRPVRVGNGAGQQVQLDVFGVVADLIAVLAESGAPLTPEHVHLMDAMVEAVRRRWHEPDHGIWEVRGPLRHHVHSKTLCWHTVSRACRVRELIGEPIRPEDVELADTIRNDVLTRGYHPERNAFTAAYGESMMDAACLLVGLTGLIPAGDERFLGTVRAIERDLLDRGTVRRYKENDGLPGTEGGFHLCTGWLIESLHLVGRKADALALLDSYAKQTGSLGLYAEERDPITGRGLGNYPQAYSHLALINACCRLAAD